MFLDLSSQSYSSVSDRLACASLRIENPSIEVNLDDIFIFAGRPRRGVTKNPFADRTSPTPDKCGSSSTPEFKKDFRRLKHIVDSEESD